MDRYAINNYFHNIIFKYCFSIVGSPYNSYFENMQFKIYTIETKNIIFQYHICMEIGGEALAASLEIIKSLYETALLYKNLRLINQRFMNKICLLITLKDHLTRGKRIADNDAIVNYIQDISKKLHKMRNKIENVGNKGFIKKIFYVRGINNLAEDISRSVEDVKFLLDIKRELDASSKMDIGNIITETKAREFWENNFGSENLFIQTNLFFSAVRLQTKLVATEIDFLKKIINDDNDKYISAFEFQEWLDFFGDFSVVMRRTIDSLIDPGTQEPFGWYHKNIGKNLVKTLLRDYNFIVRKHATQKGIFIVNFYWREVMCSIYIRNRDNRFWVERSPEQNALEYEFFCHLSMVDNSAETLKEIVARIETVLYPNKQNPTVDWNKQREELIDAELYSASNRSAPAAANSNFFPFDVSDIPLLGTIKDAIPSTDRVMNAIQFWK